jgi:UDPglucose 6-dehydrogenase
MANEGRMKIAIVGIGYVGLVAGVCFAEIGHQVTCLDIDRDKIGLCQQGISPIYEPGLQELLTKGLERGNLSFTTDVHLAFRDVTAIFIGVGTPEQSDGSANLSGLAHVARQIAETVEQDCLVVVKSTVPVGTNDKVEQFIRDFAKRNIRLEVASNPEFLAQGSAVHDTLQAARIIIGTRSRWAENRLVEIYKPFGLPIVSVSIRSAEMIKYAANSFLALKISYMNDIANLCELVGADIQDVAKGMSFDERIGARHLNAGIGFGGSCFPKDTKALEFLARQNGYDLKTVKAAIEVNRNQKTILIRKAASRLISFTGLKIAALGLTFKPGTDDLRESAAIENIRFLLDEGADVFAYDPVGRPAFAKLYPQGQNGSGRITYVAQPADALSGAHACFIFTEWQEIRDIQPQTYKQLMHTPLVFDGRNILDTQAMSDAKVEYYSIGRPAKN